VTYLIDDSARPPKRQEVVTRTASALAFWLGGTYDPDRPDHRGDGALLTGTWAVIPHYAPADVQPAFIHYDRAEAAPFEVGGQRYAQLGDAMEAAVA